MRKKEEARSPITKLIGNDEHNVANRIKYKMGKEGNRVTVYSNEKWEKKEPPYILYKGR